MDPRHIFLPNQLNPNFTKPFSNISPLWGPLVHSCPLISFLNGLLSQTFFIYIFIFIYFSFLFQDQLKFQARTNSIDSGRGVDRVYLVWAFLHWWDEIHGCQSAQDWIEGHHCCLGPPQEPPHHGLPDFNADDCRSPQSPPGTVLPFNAAGMVSVAGVVMPGGHSTLCTHMCGWVPLTLWKQPDSSLRWLPELGFCFRFRLRSWPSLDEAAFLYIPLTFIALFALASGLACPDSNKAISGATPKK